MNNFAAPSCPPNMVPHSVVRQYRVEKPLASTWWWLMQPETFTKGQVWPWRVEFIDTPMPDGSIATGFDVGTLNAHHGPFMNFCGVIADVTEGDEVCSRRLDYSYGAFAIGFRFIRPTALTVTCRAESDTATTVEMRVDSIVRPWLSGPWTLAQSVFWKGFGWVLRRSVPDTIPAK